MKLIEVNLSPTDRQLRQFGITCLFALPLAGWLLGGAGQLVSLLATAGLLLAIAGFACPRIVKPVFIALTVAAAPIGMVIGELAILVVYFGVFLPIGLVFRVMNRDALKSKFDRRAKTYWQTKKPPRSAADYYRQS